MTHSRFMLGGAVMLLTALSAAAQVNCGNATLTGQYGLYLDGSACVSAGTSASTFQRLIGLFTADGVGLASANLTTSTNGIVTTVLYTGSYSIQSNCSGVL